MPDRARAELLQIIAQLHMMSHVSAANLEPSSGDASESKGGKRPPGGIDPKGDRTPEFRQKSAEHFSARARGCKTDRDYQAVLEDAKAALEAWKRTPAIAGDSAPPYGTIQWKRWVAESKESGAELARKFNVTAQYIGQVREQYGS